MQQRIAHGGRSTKFSSLHLIGPIVAAALLALTTADALAQVDAFKGSHSEIYDAEIVELDVGGAGLSRTFFFGYCSNGPYDWPSYLPDIESAARGGYGASDTTQAEVGAGERLLNRGLVQLFTLQGRLKPQPQRHTFPKSQSN